MARQSRRRARALDAGAARGGRARARAGGDGRRDAGLDEPARRRLARRRAAAGVRRAAADRRAQHAPAAVGGAAATARSRSSTAIRGPARSPPSSPPTCRRARARARRRRGGGAAQRPLRRGGVLRAARRRARDWSAMAMTNTEPLVIPFGGAEPALGHEPDRARRAGRRTGVFDLDLATSQVAINRIFNARDEGRPIPLGWGVDEHGEPTTDAATVRSAVPLGGYKGYALAADGRDPVRRAGGRRRPARGRRAVRRRRRAPEHRPLPPRASTRSARSGASGSRRVLGGMLGRPAGDAPVAPGFDEVLAPGDPEPRARARRERAGVPIEPALWATLQAAQRRARRAVPASTTRG